MIDIHNPEYNRELIVKELALLERHLNIPEERCMEDCIPMHLLRAEALAEEAIRLGGGEEFQTYAQKVRSLRKEIMGSDHSHDDPEPIRVERGEKTYVEIYHEKGECDPKSFRVIKPNPEHIVTICCPSGQYDESAGRCLVGTMAHKIEHIHEEGSCPVCGG